MIFLFNILFSSIHIPLFFILFVLSNWYTESYKGNTKVETKKDEIVCWKNAIAVVCLYVWMK